MEPSDSTRQHHLDAIRVSAILLLIPYHGARYLQKGKADSRLVDGWVWFLHTWHLPLFFAISGFLAASALARSSAPGQIRSRPRRLGLPFVVGMLTVVPLANLMVIAVAHLRPRSEGLQQSRFFEFDRVFTFAPRHLWFLEYLLLIGLIGMVVWWLAQRGPGMLRSLAGRLGVLVSSPLGMFPMAIAGAAILSAKPGWAPGGSAANSILPVPSLLAYYGLFFGAGWVLTSADGLLLRLQRGALLKLALGLALSVPAFLLFYDSGSFTGVRGWDGALVDTSRLRLAGLICFGVVGWSMVLGI
ncbi:MAG: acyltransferase family protein, partial [Candidatus Aminicenantales bacterium]